MDNTSDFIEAGAAAMAVGSSLVNQALLNSGAVSELTWLAAGIVRTVTDGR